MFTQCEKCKAVFRINLREVTVSKGILRCGECYFVYDVTNTLSTTMPTAFQAIVDLETVNYKNFKTTTNHSSYTDRYIDSASDTDNNYKKIFPYLLAEAHQFFNSTNKWLLAAIAFFSILLPIQMYFHMQFKASEEPLHEPELIQMLNYNVFAHPDESGVLLISATMENTAKFDQPYPVIEVRLSDAQSEVIALRRFRPFEYYQNHKKGLMLSTNQQSRIKLKISDPGSKATRFKFGFY